MSNLIAVHLCENIFFFFLHAALPYLMPLLMVSVGEQLTVSTQSVQWYCLLSRNQPESDKPRTCIPVCPRLCTSSATRSTLRRTPVPPALHGKDTQHAVILAAPQKNGTKPKGFFFFLSRCETHTCFLLARGPWRYPSLCLADPLRPPV